MNKFRIWVAIILALILGLSGFFLGGLLSYPSVSPERNRAFYTIWGVLIGLLTYARIAAWLVHTFTRLATQAVSRLAVEIINQFSNLTSRKIALPSLNQDLDLDSVMKGNLDGLEGVILVDTSSVIDGRILDVARTGFIGGLIVVPGFVLRELQQVADSGNNLKRARGRYGFEIINQLKRVKGLTLQVWDEKSGAFSKLAGKTVDDKLIYLGKALKGKILTCDFNLGRVARLQGVDVLNLNDLSNALKTLPLPGEKLTVRILHSGKDKDQGIGYLPDGVMVVVKDGSSLVGQETNIEATKIIQGPAGRMVFGKRVEN